MVLAPLVVYVSAPVLPRSRQIRAHRGDAAHHFPTFLISLVALARACSIPGAGSRCGVHAGAAQRVFHRRAAFFAERFDPRCWCRLGRIRRRVLQLICRFRSCGRSACCRAGARSRHPAWRGLKLMGGGVRGVVSQVSLLINTIFASFLVTGSVSCCTTRPLMEFRRACSARPSARSCCPACPSTMPGRIRRIQPASRLGLRLTCCWRCRGSGAGGARDAADRDAVPLRTLQRETPG